MTGKVLAAIRGLAARLLALLPGPPANAPAAPDVDGRRPDTADTTAIELEILRKDGHGGYR
jgi:hypothetical protein